MIDLAKTLKKVDRLNKILSSQAKPEQLQAIAPFQTKMNEAVRAMKAMDMDKINAIIKDLNNADTIK